jgi:dipeptidyl aminopeptidase/acylaminoacyl peptidase
MRYRLRAARVLLLAGALECLFAAGAQAAPPAEVFGALPAMRYPAISPDGKHLAAIEPVNGKPAIFVFDLDAPTAPPKGYAAPDALPVGLQWSSNDRVVGLYAAEQMHDENTGLYLRQFVRAVSISISNGTPFILMKGSRAFNVSSGNATFIGLDPASPGRVLMSAYDISGETLEDTRLKQSFYAYNLYSVDADSGDIRQIARGVEGTQSWITGSKGQALARIDMVHDLKGDLYVQDAGSWRKSLTIDESAGMDMVPVAATPDDSALLIERYGSAGTLELDPLPLAQTSFGQTLYSNPQYDIDNVFSDAWSGQIVGVSYIDDKEQSNYFQPDLARWQRSLEKSLPGETVVLVSWDKARTRILVSTETPKEPRIYNLFTPATGQLVPLASEYPTLQASDLGDMKPYAYDARDGLKIHAYLTLPPGKAPKNLPTVIFPHGGPESRDALAFDWWAQFMASRGYAVLQPNFRGSTGYGQSFRDAGFNQWGKKMQDDISDGVRKLVADGIADPKRVCIVGASYGGYAALAGATFSPDLYACAVSFAGIGDVSTIIGSAVSDQGSDSPVVAYWESRIGSRFKDAAFLSEISPAKHAENVRAPILLLHCTNDVTVPIAQSQIEQAALQKAGKKVDFVTIEGDDHYLQVAATRIRVLQEVQKFLAANIGN